MNTYYVGSIPVSDELYHHGIKGQKWGIRRYQNPDGSLTPAGIARYGTVENLNKELLKEGRKEDSRSYKYNKSGESGWKGLGRAIKAKASGIDKNKIKKGLIIGGSIAAAGLAAYGGYKLSNAIKDNQNMDGFDAYEKVRKALGGEDGYDPNGIVTIIKGDKGDITSYYSPDYAKQLIREHGSLPGSHAKNYSAMTKAMYDHMQLMKKLGKN